MATSATVPEVPTGIAPAATGSGGVAGSRPVTPRNHAKASATAIGAAEARIHHTHGPTGSWRRRTRAKPSTATSIGASSREAIEQPHGPQGQHLAQRDERARRAAELQGRSVVERGERAQGGAPEGLQPGRVAHDRVVGRRRALAADGHQRRREVVGHQRALLAHRDREGQASPLRRRARAARVGAGLLAHRGLDGAAQLQRTDPVPRRPAGDERPAHGRPRDVAEHEDRPGAAGEALGRGRARPRARRCRRWWRRRSRCASDARRAPRGPAPSWPRCPTARRARRGPARRDGPPPRGRGPAGRPGAR